MLDWIGLPDAVGWWLLVGSAVTFGMALVAVPLMVARIPADYFAHETRSAMHRPRRWRWVWWIFRCAKNVLGVGCLFFGVLMLVLPGQGMLTILLGITLLDFPGKYRLQRWIVRRKGVLESVNWMRRRAGRPPLRVVS